MAINFYGVKQAEGILDELSSVKNILEKKLNLSCTVSNERPVTIANNKIMRICFVVGLCNLGERKMEEIKSILLSKNSQRIVDSFFTKNNLSSLYSALLKIRYNSFDIDWTDITLLSKIIAYEMLRGRDVLQDENNLNSFLYAVNSRPVGGVDIPALELLIGEYDEDMEATLDINSRAITNSQILVAGATGSGKTNLLAVLIQQIRSRSIETHYPVNFLLFDYKGEFSDISNSHWLSMFETNRTCILDPIEAPLPFTPFKNFIGKTINEINLYSTEMATALCALDNARISANMSNRLSEAIVDAYKETNGSPINFELILDNYLDKLPNPDKDDSISSILKQLVRNKLFENEDKLNLIDECFVIKMDAFPKDGPMAKAIVYFLIAKLNLIYEELEKQAVGSDYVQIRHFTIID